MNKKLVSGIVAATMIAGLAAPTLAATKPAETKQEVKQATAAKQERKITTWVQDGITFTVNSDHELTLQEKSSFAKAKLEPAAPATSAPLASTFGAGTYSGIVANPEIQLPMSDGSATTEYGPENRTYDNSVTVSVLTTVVNLINGATPAITYWLTKSGTASAVAGAAATTFCDKIKDWLKDHTYSYVTFWTSKAYSNYYGCYIHYDTLVQYTSSARTTVSAVYYYDTGTWTAS